MKQRTGFTSREGGARSSRGFCGGKHKLVRFINISLVYMRLCNELTLTSIYVEGEEEL